MKIVVDTEPSQADHDIIRAGLRAYNDCYSGHVRDYREFAVVLRDDKGEAVGGLWANSVLGWMSIEMLHVPEALRGQNLGTKLMEAAEAHAREAGLVGIWLDTFSFQARPFYEKLGYGVFGTIENFPVGGARHFLCKHLTTPVQNETPT